MKLPSLLKSTTELATSPSWAWPSCRNPKTLSFRSQPVTFSAEPQAPADGGDGGGGGGGGESIEEVIGRLRTEERRLFFEPEEKRLFFEPEETSSIMGRAGPMPDYDDDALGLKESVVVEMESKDPYGDLRRSMEEMVEAHELREWEALEELLGWYLWVNGKHNHGYVVGAFVDLLVGLGFASSTTLSSSSSSSSISPSCCCDSDRNDQCFSNSLMWFSSSTASSTSPYLTSSLEAEDVIEKTTVVDDDISSKS